MDVESDAGAWQAHEKVARNYVKFYPKWTRNNFQSEAQKTEVGEYRDFILIICPGQPKSEVRREVQDKDKQEYAPEWAAYKAGKEQRLTGTPVELLPGLDAGRADSMKAIYIHSIEQLAEASEPAMRSIGMGALELKNRAIAFLQKNSTEVLGLKQALSQRDEVIAALEQRIVALESKPKIGRPRKEVA
jgi:hypothetical protein